MQVFVHSCPVFKLENFNLLFVVKFVEINFQAVLHAQDPSSDSVLLDGVLGLEQLFDAGRHRQTVYFRLAFVLRDVTDLEVVGALVESGASSVILVFLPFFELLLDQDT